MCADWAHLGLQIRRARAGYFDTKLTEALVNDGEFSAWLAVTTRRPMGAHRGTRRRCCSSRLGVGLRNGQILYLDGGLTAVV